MDSPEKALEHKNLYGVDGIMIGRGAIGYPWIFREIKHYLKTGEKLLPPTIAERVDVCKRHLGFSLEWKGDRKGIFEMRRHYTAYFKGIQNFKPFRTRLVEAVTPEEIWQILDEVEGYFSSEEMGILV